MSDYWGKELIIDCAACNIEKITDESNIKNFIRYLVEKIDMEAHGDPLIEHFATHDPEKAGYSFCQMITTSAITAHFVDKNGDCYINVFSCKDFNPADVIDCIDTFFNPSKVSFQFINRRSPR